MPKSCSEAVSSQPILASFSANYNWNIGSIVNIDLKGNTARDNMYCGVDNFKSEVPFNEPYIDSDY